jgi:hypothetical protein
MGGAARRFDSDELTKRVRGSYGMTNLLAQIKFDVFPLNTVNLGDKSVATHGPTRETFDPARYPFLVEIRADGFHIFSWSFAHQNQALNGSFGETGSGWGQISPSRSHGLGDALNFVFMSGHVETIARNDSRSVPELDKNWYVSAANPNGMFSNNVTGTVPNGIPGRSPGDKIYWSHEGQIGDNTYRELYPQFAP